MGSRSLQYGCEPRFGSLAGQEPTVIKMGQTNLVIVSHLRETINAVLKIVVSVGIPERHLGKTQSALGQKNLLPVVALFGPTCQQEIDLFGRGIKIVSSHDCVPCYRRNCEKNPSCMDVIPAEKIMAAVGDICRTNSLQNNDEISDLALIEDAN